MKTAIILNGFVRTWETCKQSFHETFDHLNADVFISTYNMKYGYAPYIKGLINFHDDEPLNENYIPDNFSGLNIRGVTITPTQEMDNVVNDLKPKIQINYHNIESFLAQTLNINKAFNMIAEYEKAHNFKYDQVIKTRCDLIYYKFDPVVEHGQVLIDSGSTFPNDCFYMARRNEMQSIQDFMMNEYFNPVMLERSSYWPPHSILHSAFIHNNLHIKTEPIMDYVERVNLKQKY